MKKVALWVGLMMLVALPAVAQEAPRAEFFAGYSYLSLGDGGRLSVPGGFQFQVAGNFNDYLGIAADFGAHSKSGVQIYEYMVGPRFTSRGDTTSGFFHLLVGGVTVSNGASVNGFAVTFGSGLDVNVSDHIAIRVAQFDYLLERLQGNWTTGTIRYGFGIVFKAGSVGF
ncbi:MAG: hypothetical protein ACE5H2_03530 [Terriglobia bacterium]